MLQVQQSCPCGHAFAAATAACSGYLTRNLCNGLQDLQNLGLFPGHLSVLRVVQVPFDLLRWRHQRRHSVVEDGKVGCYSGFVVADLRPYLAFVLCKEIAAYRDLHQMRDQKQKETFCSLLHLSS